MRPVSSGDRDANPHPDSKSLYAHRHNMTRGIAFICGTILLAAPSWLREDQPDQKTVLVAKYAIKAETTLSDSHFSTRLLPEEFIHPFQVPVQDQSFLIGRRLKHSLSANQVILWSDIQEEAEFQQNLSSTIPVGYRAVTLPLKNIDTFGGLVAPGDIVDLYWLGEREAKPFLNSVQIAALDHALPGDPSPGNARTVTFALPESHSKVLLQIRNRQLLGMMLRNPTDVTDVTPGQAYAELGQSAKSKTPRPKIRKKPEKPVDRTPDIQIFRGR